MSKVSEGSIKISNDAQKVIRHHDPRGLVLPLNPHLHVFSSQIIDKNYSSIFMTPPSTSGRGIHQHYYQNMCNNHFANSKYHTLFRATFIIPRLVNKFNGTSTTACQSRPVKLDLKLEPMKKWVRCTPSRDKHLPCRCWIVALGDPEMRRCLISGATAADRCSLQ
jgi:hypothetical protein